MEVENKNQSMWPIYSWTEGSFYYRIERNLENGTIELIAKIPKSVYGARMITIETTMMLHLKRHQTVQPGNN